MWRLFSFNRQITLALDQIICADWLALLSFRFFICSGESSYDSKAWSYMLGTKCQVEPRTVSDPVQDQQDAWDLGVTPRALSGNISETTISSKLYSHGRSKCFLEQIILIKLVFLSNFYTAQLAVSDFPHSIFFLILFLLESNIFLQIIKGINNHYLINHFSLSNCTDYSFCHFEFSFVNINPTKFSFKIYSSRRVGISA